MTLISRLDRGLGFARGDAFPIRRRVNQLQGRTLTKAWLTVKTLLSDADPGIFQKEITTSPTSGTGEIEDNGTNGVAKLRFDVSGTNTEAMTADLEYFYDIQVKDSGGNVYTLESGFVSAIEEVTKTDA